MTALLPIFAYFLVGVALRLTGIASRDHAQFILRLVFFVTLPALAFVSISSRPLALGSIALPVAGFLVNLGCALIALVYVRLARLEPATAGAVVMGSGVTNVTFMIPFIAAGLGPDVLAAAILYDAGNAIFLATGAYIIADRFGDAQASSALASLGKMLRTPLLLSVVAAVVVSSAAWTVPAPIISILQPLGETTSPLVLIALGAALSTAQLRSLSAYGTVGIRMLGGLLVGLFLVMAFGLRGAAAIAVIAAASAPIGFNTVTLASISNLDVEHSAASLFISVLVGLATASTIVLLGARWLAA